MFYIYCTRCIIITISKDTCDSGGKGGGGGGGVGLLSTLSKPLQSQRASQACRSQMLFEF